MPDHDPEAHGGLLSSLGIATGANAFARWLRDRRDHTLITPFSLTKPDGSVVSKDDIGRLGEDLAEYYLRTQERMKPLRRNFRAPKGGEVDLVCRHGETLVFIEVKTRTSTDFGRPLDAVTKDKQRLITRGAIEWLRLLRNPDIHFRFDVMEVILVPGDVPKLQRIENAFELPEPLYYPTSGFAQSNNSFEDTQHHPLQS